ncbi:unannotated protein [freshwater metagenome]|uniref:Unannotated protein n=1 Tax=freshwater metagenome TaxID=449393 RepID=A0A6J7FJD2_9ZZZZ
MASRVSFSASWSHSACRYVSITSANSAVAFGPAMVLANAASSMGASARNKKSTIAATSSRRVMRVCTSGAIAENTTGLNCSGFHGTSGANTKGAHASTNASGLSALMYSPLNAASFLRSKKAGE